MKPLLFIPLLLLAACSHTVTLYPRGGGEKATGTLNDGAQTMEITLKGKVYRGSYVLGQTVGFGFGQTFSGTSSTFGSGMVFGNDNKAAALLRSDQNVLRCEFVIETAKGGNGVCVDKDNVTYDMLAEVQ